MSPVLDQPVKKPVQKDKAHPYNLATAIIDGIGWPLGMAFFSTSTIIPAFMIQLHAGYFLMSLVPALLSLGYLVPGLFVAGRISRMPFARSYLFWVGICERIPLFMIAASVYFISPVHSHLLLSVLCVLMMVHSIALGFNQSAYWSIIEKMLPPTSRGRTFGTAGLIGGLLALGVDPVMGHLLKHGTGLSGYAGCFLIGAILICFSFLPFGLIREPRMDVESDLIPIEKPWAQVNRVWRSNRSFRRLVWAQVGASMWTCAPVFFMSRCQERIHGGTFLALASACTAVAAVSGALGNLGWGAWADKKGNRIVLIASSSLLAIGTALIFTAHTPIQFELIFALTALGNGGLAIASGNALLEIAPSHNQVPAYSSTMNAIMAIPRAIAPILGGIIAIHIGLTPVFALAAASSLFCILSAFQMKEPRGKRVGG